MRSLDVIRQKRRFEMFSAKTKDAVLEINSFFGKYNMHFDEKIKKYFIYYDTPNFDLQKSHIVLFKTQIGKLTELNFATERMNTSYRYTTRTNYKHFVKQIRPLDSLMKHKEFLIDSFKDMFLSSINFDPEFLFRKLQPVYRIDTISNEYRSVNTSGLKITYSFDSDTYTNYTNNVKLQTNILTIYQHSPENTNADFEDLMSKLTRYCKELTPTTETKIMIARRLTKEKPIPVSKNKSKNAKNAKDNKKEKNNKNSTQKK